MTVPVTVEPTFTVEEPGTRLPPEAETVGEYGLPKFEGPPGV